MQSMEFIIRGFGVVNSAPVNRVFERPAPPEERPPAAREWGDGSEFIFPPQINYSWNWPDDLTEGESEEPEPPASERRLTEVARATSPLRVENPNDPEQFVIVERIDSLIMLDSATGETITMEFRNP